MTDHLALVAQSESSSLAQTWKSIIAPQKAYQVDLQFGIYEFSLILTFNKLIILTFLMKYIHRLILCVLFLLEKMPKYLFLKMIFIVF